MTATQTTAAGVTARAGCGPLPAQSRPVVLVRCRPDTAGQVTRTVHVVSHTGPMTCGAVTPRCGALLAVEQIEIVNPGEGMPCTLCILLRSSTPPPVLPGKSRPEVTGSLPLPPTVTPAGWCAGRSHRSPMRRGCSAARSICCQRCAPHCAHDQCRDH